eukprot:6175192-Pleurochrysis_carterae.AAC.3
MQRSKDAATVHCIYGVVHAAVKTTQCFPASCVIRMQGGYSEHCSLLKHDDLWPDSSATLQQERQHHSRKHVTASCLTENFIVRRRGAPQTVTNVTIATQRKLTHIDVVMQKCSMHLAHSRFGGRSISTNDVSVKPAMMAACVPTAEKLTLKSLSSFSRSTIERFFTSDCSSSLSAASMLTAARRAWARGGSSN